MVGTPTRAPFPPEHGIPVAVLDPLPLDSHVTRKDGNHDTGTGSTHVPGEPNCELQPHAVQAFLTAELGTPVLDEIHRQLWMVTKCSGRNIDPLHRQVIKGRTIVVSEDAGLHLLWQRSRLFVKPIPPCLFSFDIWTKYLLPESAVLYQSREDQDTAQSPLSAQAAGFLRSYAFLIQHRSDFRLAQAHHLLPEGVSWAEWARFINHFRTLDDHLVSTRYHYGQIRLSRLDWLVRLLRPARSRTAWFYEIPVWSITGYVQKSTLPLLFLFASLSLALSSMQVLVTISTADVGFASFNESEAEVLRRACWVFSVTVLFFAGLTWILLLTIPGGVLVLQMLWGFRHRES